MKVEVLEALEDNYMYLVIDEATNRGAVVDPVEPDAALAAAEALGVTLTAILTTHHHWDHAGGNIKLLEKVPGIPVYGGDDRIGGLTKKVKHEYEFKIDSLTIKCLRTPCHTTGHVCYYVTDSKGGAVFTGDTLFFSGCGRFFEGTAAQMFTALIDILGSLPDSTEVFCGHEYTVTNLKFAKLVEPGNKIVTEKLLWAEGKRNSGEVTVPSTIGAEKQYNPFMRVNETAVQEFTKTSDPISVMNKLRSAKDSFKPV